jgi:hypothetical protein
MLNPRRLSVLGLSLAAVLQVGCALRGPAPEAGAGQGQLFDTPADIGQAPLALAVFKERRELVVLREGVRDESFQIRLGSRPEGHKARQGDLRTPEGVYRVCRVKPSRFKSFLWLTYPNERDALQALEEERLTPGEYRRIVEALASGDCPPPDTPLGGLVGIHGDYEEPPRVYDWTEGCIALARNEDLLRLASVVRPGTPVLIYP